MKKIPLLLSLWIMTFAVHAQGVLCTTSTSGAASQSCPTIPNGVKATTQSPGDSTADVATDAFVAAAIATVGSPVVLQSGLPFIYPPAGYMDATGNLVIGQAPAAGQTVYLSSSTAGTGITATFSAATLTGTSAGDVGRVITFLDGAGVYKTAVVTAFSSSTVATVTLNTTLTTACTSGAPCSNIWLSGPVYTASNVGGSSAATASVVAISGTAGQFTCTCSGVDVGQTLTISGTYGGTGSITGYVNPTVYLVSASGAGTFSITTLAGAAIVTSVGTPTGLTYTFGQLFSAPLDSTHAAVFMRFPASSPIGTASWYPCVMTSPNLTIAVCYNNPYVSPGNPTWPGSLTAFSGLTPGTYTPVLNSVVVGPLVSIAAGSMGVNGIIDAAYSMVNNNSANFKVTLIAFGAANPVNVSASTVTNTVVVGRTINQASPSAQVSDFLGNSTVFAPTYGTVATASAQNYSFSFDDPTPFEWIMLLMYSVKEYSH